MTSRLSHSGLQAFRDCKRKYYYRYVLGLQKRYDHVPALHYGKLWHCILATLFSTGEPPRIGELEASEHDKRRAMAMLAGYLARWPVIPLVSLSECEFDVPVRNPSTGRRSRRFSQFGYVDMLALHDDGNVTPSPSAIIAGQPQMWLWEHKTAGSVDSGYIEKLFSDSQITGYYAALQDMGIDVEGVIYDVALKPRLRQKKSEDAGDFYGRLAEWHMRPEAYHREEIYISAQQVRDWREDAWQVTQDILTCRRTGHWYRNTGRCFDYFSTCEFAPLCQNGAPEALINAEYEPRESPSTERNNQPEKPIW